MLLACSRILDNLGSLRFLNRCRFFKNALLKCCNRDNKATLAGTKSGSLFPDPPGGGAARPAGIPQPNLFASDLVLFYLPHTTPSNATWTNNTI